jgi:uncharacterized membrane protein YkvA (DUF1232 family)
MPDKDKGKDKTDAVLAEKIAQVKAQAGQDMDIAFDAAEYAPKFQEWIDSYERDVALFKEILSAETAPPQLRRLMAGGLMYMIRQFDLIPDQYQPVGTIDDTIVLRVIADLSAEWTSELEDPRHMKALFKLANQNETTKSFLGDEDYRTLENYVRTQPEKATHGITGDAAISSAQTRKELLFQVDEELKHFQAPAIEDAPRVERELKSYLRTKLTKK